MFWFVIGIVIALMGGFIVLSALRPVLNVIGWLINEIHGLL